jgi:DNA-binding XRE family transcriptional regulator
MPKKKTPTSAPKSAPTVNEPQKEPIRNNVRKLRWERKWTQWQLAQISRLSQRTIQRIERGARMGVTAELALASAFEVEIFELYAGAPPGKGGETEPGAAKTFQILKRLVSGAAVLDIIEETEVVSFDARVSGDERSKVEDFLQNTSMQSKVEDFLQHMGVWKVAGQEVEPTARVKVQQVFQSKLDELDACGVYVFGGRSSESLPNGTSRQQGVLVFKRANDPHIIHPRLLRQFGKALCLITVPVDR